MATSGTRTWSLDVDEIVRDAVDLAGGQQILGNDVQALIRAFNLVQTELTNRKINLFTLQPKTLDLSTGVAEYAVSASDVDILNAAVRQGSGSTQSDVRIERVGFDLYAQITNKNSQGRPTLYYVNRGVDNPTVTVWPVPDQSYTLYYWVFQRFEDITGLAQDPAFPFRFNGVLTNGLAYQLARRRSAQAGSPAQLEGLVARLKAEYEEALNYATAEDRERVSTFVLPGLGTP